MQLNDFMLLEDSVGIVVGQVDNFVDAGMFGLWHQTDQKVVEKSEDLIGSVL